MYAPSYGYVPGNVFNTSAIPSQSQTPLHQQNGHHQHQHQQQQQQQHSVFSSQQYGDPVAPPPLISYNSAGNTGTLAMVPNSGIAHIGSGNAVPSYQTPYSSSPYSGGIHTPSPSMAQNFTHGSNVLPNYGMNIASPRSQNQTSRLQPSLNSPTLTQHASRASPFASGQQNTSPNSGSIQTHLPTPQNYNQHFPSNLNAQQVKPAPAIKPQTTNFPPRLQNTTGQSTIALPVNHESDIREKERVTLLLNINRQLLLEVMRLQAAQQDIKDEQNNRPITDGVERAKGPISSRYHFECMRRLQANLAYLAARADRNKNHNILSHPQIMSAPTASPTTTQKKMLNITSPNLDVSIEDDEKRIIKGEDRSELIKAYYNKLQSLFPNVDPKKDSILNPIGRAAQIQKQNSVDSGAQQKAQGEIYRAKIMNPQHISHQQQMLYQQQYQPQQYQPQQYQQQQYHQPL